MTFSLEVLHQPLNDFFLSRYATAEGNPVLFRFDKFGSVLSDADFRDPRQPDAGYSPQVARERVSDLVNRIPIDAGDGVNVVLTADSVDNTYFDRLLGPSEAYLPDGTTAATRSSILSSFSAMKSRALHLWDQLTLESGLGLSSFRPVDATPAGWYDPDGGATWSTTSFEIVGDAGGAAAEGPPMEWKLAPSDAVLVQALELPAVEAAVAEPAPVAERLAALRLSPGMRLQPGLSAVIRDHRIGSAATEVAPAPDPAAGGGVLGGTLIERALTLDLRKRLAIQQYVGEQAPAEPVRTNQFTISFEYCLVNVHRDWMLDSFLNDRSWHIPNVARGDLTAGGRSGNLPLLPVGFVAIRKLHITANWSAEDLAHAGDAMSFGPFSVQADTTSGELSQPGQQVIGWMLQLMPPLPPNPEPPPEPGGPDPVPSAATGHGPGRTHTVKSGETLWAIAQKAYGDGSRWPQIAHVNHISDPTLIHPGQKLRIP